MWSWTIVLKMGMPIANFGRGLDTKICGMSAITTAILIQACVYRASELLLENGIVPPVFKSQNVDGGPEYNDKLVNQYFDRMYHI